jgi:hypothetical protein
MDFIVLGLPRSATTWLSVWLTTDRSLCLHDPFAAALPEDWPRDARRFGISCTGAYLFPKWLARQECPVAVITRDPGACDASLHRIGLGGCIEPLHDALATVDGRRWRFTDLWNEEKARALWAFLLPGIAFDATRYRQLRDIQIQPHMGKWRFDPAIYNEMKRREAGG